MMRTAGCTYSVPLFLLVVGEHVSAGHLLIGPFMGLVLHLDVERVPFAYHIGPAAGSRPTQHEVGKVAS